MVRLSLKAIRLLEARKSRSKKRRRKRSDSALEGLVTTRRHHLEGSWHPTTTNKPTFCLVFFQSNATLVGHGVKRTAEPPLRPDFPWSGKSRPIGERERNEPRRAWIAAPLERKGRPAALGWEAGRSRNERSGLEKNRDHIRGEEPCHRFCRIHVASP